MEGMGEGEGVGTWIGILKKNLINYGRCRTGSFLSYPLQQPPDFTPSFHSHPSSTLCSHQAIPFKIPMAPYLVLTKIRTPLNLPALPVAFLTPLPSCLQHFSGLFQALPCPSWFVTRVQILGAIVFVFLSAWNSPICSDAK